MTCEEFYNKYKGQVVDFDGAFGGQCVDLARQYFKDVWQVPQQPEGCNGARDFFVNRDARPVQNKYMDCVVFDGSVAPPAGSVVIFDKTDTNQYGHIAICMKADYKGMIVFEQDGIGNEKALKEGRPQKPAWSNTRDYARLLGWLVKK